MADSRFFLNKGPFSLSDIAAACQTEIDSKNQNIKISDVAPLDKASSEHLSFLDNVKYKSALQITKARAVIVHEDMASYAPKDAALLICKTPYQAYAKAASLFYPDSIMDVSGAMKEFKAQEIIDPSAIIAPSAIIGKNCRIGAYVTIEEGVEIGDNVNIEPHSHIGSGCQIGAHSHIGSHCSIGYCMMGAYTRVHNGARIGQDGFGFAFTEQGFLPVPQLGRVIIEDHVNIGANTTIDRGSSPDTVIGQGTIIDNLVQIAHNVEIGKGCIIVAQAGISGSTKIGNYVVIAGQAGLAGHLDIGDGVKIGAQSGVSKSIPAGTDVMGYPAQEKRAFWRELATLRKLSSKDIKKRSKE